MKKIIAFSVLLALLSAAVFAQDDSGWKIGVAAQITRDFFYTTKATATGESTDPSGTNTLVMGDYIKGSSDVFTYTDGHRNPNRLIVSLGNWGEHYAFYIDAKIDDDWITNRWNGKLSFMKLISGGAEDWYVTGDTGALGEAVVFDGKVGSGRYGGFVPVYEFWDDWLGTGDYNFFGVQRMDRFQQSDNISVTNLSSGPWDDIYAIGVTFGGNIRFAFGSTLDLFAKGFDNPVASASSIQAGFMLSGKGIADILSFDVFYAVNGEDKNTVARGTGAWDNLLGVYIGLGLVENLGLSIGYTASFHKAETAQEPNKAGDGYVPYETSDPIWSGVDLKIKFTGIDKIGITFNNNLSFASAESVEIGDDPGYARVNGLDGNSLVVAKKDSLTQNWFAWNAILGFNFALTDNLGLTFALMNRLSVFSTDGKTDMAGTSVTTTESTTKDNLDVSLRAEYSAGSVTFGLGLNFGIAGVSLESESKGGSTTTTLSGSLNTVTFSVPLFFKVAI